MSRSEHESGSITIPRSEWAKLKSAVVEVHNAHRLALFEAAVALVDKLVEVHKGKRKVEWSRAAMDMLRAQRLTSRERIGENAWDERARDIVELILPFDRQKNEAAKRPRKPKKKDLGLLSARTAKTIDSDLGRITFDDEKRVVTWSVSENNHACETARAHPVGVAFFEALGRIKWTRGTGGKIVGNDEYNRESRHEGGGANYVTSEYSQEAQKKAVEARARQSRPLRSTFGFGY